MIYEVCLISYFATHFTLIFACDCFNDTNLGENAPVRCICTESNKIPDTGNIHTLVLRGFDLETVGYKQFFQFKDTLTDLYLSEFYNLKQIKKNTFNELPHLRSLYLSKAPLLLDISLDILENNSNEIRVLRVIHTGIRGLPKLRLPKHIMDIIDFEGNAIQHIETNCVWVNTAQLIFDYNEITKINGWAFNNSQISKMSLKGNKKLEILAEEAFHGLRSLTSLDLSDTAITYIPTYGLKELEVLIIRQTHSLKTIPSIYDFDNLKEAELTFSFHCCAFHLPRRHNPLKYALHKAYVQKMKNLCPESSKYPVPAANLHEDAEDLPDEEWHDIANSSRKKRSISQTLLPLQNKTLIAFCGSLRYREERVYCLPEPNAFNPCEDIMGYKWLRFCVWIVVLTGLLGNICVLAVILCKPAEMTVQNFLICNLAFSDLCMACFLSLLAVEDLISEGMYFNYAYDWQQGKGCKVAGFITIFSCQLSIFLLSLVTVERWFTIKRALYMNKMTFRRTASIVCIGWICALIMAAAPLFGISNYSTTSLCLPMETENFWDTFYILLLLFIAFAAFITICMCYYQIYFSLSYETRHKDGEYVLARKMTILVAMNFVCWAPITFFALTAVLGFPLINITDSKILLVFFYPLNSCANPFLYAILTTNFKRDLMYLMSKFGICKKRVKRYKMTYYQPKKNTKNPIHRPFTSQTSL